MALMQPLSLFLYTVRGIIMFMMWALCQLPQSWNIQVDVAQVIDAITMQVGETRQSAGPWPEAPTMAELNGSAPAASDPLSADVDNCSGTRQRDEIQQRWKARTANVKRYIPFVQRRAKSSTVDADEDSDLGE